MLIASTPNYHDPWMLSARRGHSGLPGHESAICGSSRFLRTLSRPKFQVSVEELVRWGECVEPSEASGDLREGEASNRKWSKSRHSPAPWSEFNASPYSLPLPPPALCWLCFSPPIGRRQLSTNGPMASFSLAALPDELLDLILQIAPSVYVIELLKCGDRQLTLRLCRSGCTKLDLRDSALFSMSRWPSVLSRLSGLRSLKLSNSWFLGRRNHVRNGVKRLPTALEVLDLEYPWLSDIFEVIVPSRRPTAQNKQQTVALEAFKPETTSPSPPIAPAKSARKRRKAPPPVSIKWDFASILPNLTHLRLSLGEKMNLELHKAPEYLDFSFLPRTLISFVLEPIWACDRLEDMQSQLSSLPPNLQTLSLNRQHVLLRTAHADLFRALPFGLRNFSFRTHSTDPLLPMILPPCPLH